MGTIPVVPTFPAGYAAQGAQLQELCTAITWLMTGRPWCQLQQAGAQSVANTTTTAIAWDTKIVDRDSGWSSGTDNRYTAKTPGYYLAAASVTWTANSTGDRALWFQVTTGSGNPAGSGLTTPFGYSALANAGALTSAVVSSALTPYLYVNDYVQVLVYQSSGGALATAPGASPGSPGFTISLASG